jgi:hypothetical protein
MALGAEQMKSAIIAIEVRRFLIGDDVSPIPAQVF